MWPPTKTDSTPLHPNFLISPQATHQLSQDTPLGIFSSLEPHVDGNAPVCLTSFNLA